MTRLSLAVLLLAVAALPGACTGAEPAVQGVRPVYTRASLSSMPNAAAIQARIWAPGLNEGYVPQGLALADGAVLVAGYRSTERGQDRGPCRVFRVDPATGAVTGGFDVPSECGHAGGLAYDGQGRLYVVDTRVALEVDLARALKEGHARLAIIRRLRLGGGVRGSLATFHDGALWIGSWNPNGPGALFGFPQQALLNLPGEALLDEGMAARRITLPPRAQGAAFDATGRLWVALSNTRQGELAVLDGAGGRELARYPAAPGIEGIAFAGPARLWAVAEVGSQRWLHGLPFHPLVFALDPTLLK